MRLTINGVGRGLARDRRTTLDALREHAGLTGTRKGCDQGRCGTSPGSKMSPRSGDRLALDQRSGTVEETDLSE